MAQHIIHATMFTTQSKQQNLNYKTNEPQKA